MTKEERKFIDLHVHTAEGSLRDTASTCEQLVEQAVKLGASALAVTDHGNMTAVQDFRVACEKAGIKPIYGCEYYVDIGDGARTHLIVLAKNIDGYNAISKVCTASAYNMHSDRPIVTLEMLQQYFAPGTIGHGNVIATSACMQGPLCRKLLVNFSIEKEIEKLKKKQSKEVSPSNPDYLNLLEEATTKQAALQTAKEQSKENTATANLKWKALWNKAYRSEDPELIKEAEELKERACKAEKDKAAFKAAEKKAQAENTAAKDALAPVERSVERYKKWTEQIIEKENEKIATHEAVDEAIKCCEYFISLFGTGNFYIELQNHDIKEEIFSMPTLVDIANALEVPVVITNDVHYAKKEDALTRHYNHVQYQNYSWNDMEPQDWELYIKSNKEIRSILKKIIPEEIIEAGIKNTFKIAEGCNVKFDIKPHYPAFPTPEGAKLHLRQLISMGKRKVTEWNSTYQKRLEYELRIIEKMGFSDYLCIVEDFLNYARLIGKIDLDSEEFLANPYDMAKIKELAKNQVGEGCGPGRGSAAGSLVCYLVGITNIDPIPNELLFERFLNPERVTMPDIDSDIPPKVRPWVIGYIKNRYGEKAVAQIMTRAYFGAKSSIQAAARVMGKRDGDEKKYLSTSIEMSKSIEDANASLKDLKDSLVDPTKPETEELFNIALSLEGLPSGYGTHAAGIVVSDNSDISDYTPLINVSGAIDTQLDLNWVEPMGMLKLDLLGLRNLGIITECEKAVQKEYGINLSMDEFPQDPEVYREIFSKGLTDGVFQFESDGMKKLLTSFCPESISDLTLLNAMFRPGPLQYIDEVTAVKKGEKKPEYIIPEMAEILDVTYGKPIYQEQIMAIFNKFAGFSLGEADVIRRLMSKKKVEAFTSYKGKFIDGLVAFGATKANAEKFWDELLNFSQYAFNKSHSRAYAEVAYATAYLKYKYPEAYACGLLNYTPKDKMIKMIIDAQNRDVSICCPDINYSDSDFTIQGNRVFFGLRPIPQVAASAEEILKERKVNGKYLSLKDFIKRTSPKKNVCENLIKAGAFDGLENGRTKLLLALPELLDLNKNIKDKEKILKTETNEKKISNATKALEKFTNAFEYFEYPDVRDADTKLADEKELLGYYISAHPLSKVYKKTSLKKAKLNVALNVIAVIDESETKITKAGEPMLLMKISDTTDIVSALMFPGDYKKLTETPECGKIYSFYGTLKQDAEETKFFVKSINKYTKEDTPIQLHCADMAQYERNIEKILPWVDTTSSGKKLDVFLEDIKKVYPTGLIVSPDIVKADIDWN